jgi:hypothetical protein
MVRVWFRRIALLFGLFLVFKPIGFGFAFDFAFGFGSCFTVNPATVKRVRLVQPCISRLPQAPDAKRSQQQIC